MTARHESERPGIVRSGANAIQIDRGERGDLPSVVRLLEEVLPGSWSAQAVRDELERSDARIWVARGEPADPGALRAPTTAVGDSSSAPMVGFLIQRHGLDVSEILLIGVLASERRRGTGRALVSRAVEEAGDRGLTRLDLEVRANNAPALDFYAAEGFVVQGRRPRYYRGGGDAVLMSRGSDRPAASPRPDRKVQPQ